MHSFLAPALALALLSPASVLAQDRLTPRPTAMDATPRLSLHAETGVLGNTQSPEGIPATMAMGLMVLTDLGPLRLGVRGEGYSYLVSSHTLAGAAVAGVGMKQGRWRFDLLGQLGVRHTWDISNPRFAGLPYDGHVSATLPTAGGRLGVSYVATHAQRDYSFGLWGFVDRDLATREVGHSALATDGSPSGERFGGTRYGALVSVGVEFDLSSPPPSQVAAR